MSRLFDVVKVFVLASGLLLAPAASADPPAGPGGGEEGHAGHPRYDTATVTTLKGEIAEVMMVTPKMPMMAKRFGKGVHVMLKGDKETLEVHLGPLPFVEKQGLKVQSGDRLEVTGSRVTIDGKPVLLAEKVKKGDQTVTLRDADGTPRWRGMMGEKGEAH